MHFKILSAICFNLGQPKILLLGNDFTLSQMTKFGLFKLKDFADDNFKTDEKGRRLPR